MTVSFLPHARFSASALTLLFMSLLATGLNGCSHPASMRKPEAPAEQDQAGNLASKDFLSVLPQLLDPHTTTIHVGPESGTYTQQLLLGMKKLGYGIRRVTTDQGPDFMSFSEKVSNVAGEELIKGYTVYLGDIGLERDYAVARADGRARPASPLRIIGSRKKVTLNAESGLGVEQRNAASINRVVYLRDERPRNASAFSPLVKNKTYNSYFNLVNSASIDFENSSSALQTLQKSKLMQLVKLYNEKTDIFKLVVCVSTNLSDRPAQEKLSLSRLRHVSRSLRDLGINADVIHTDHCTPYDKATNRRNATQNRLSVVVELRR